MIAKDTACFARGYAFFTMNISDAVRSGFDHFTNWKGRASRPAFWWLYLASLPLGSLPYYVGRGIGGPLGTLLLVVGGIISLIFILPVLSATVRRLHDTGKSGWWYWIILIPLAGIIVLIVFLASEGEAEDNQYGPNPGSGVSEPGEMSVSPAV